MKNFTTIYLLKPYKQNVMKPFTIESLSTSVTPQDSKCAEPRSTMLRSSMYCIGCMPIPMCHRARAQRRANVSSASHDETCSPRINVFRLTIAPDLWCHEHSDTLSRSPSAISWHHSSQWHRLYIAMGCYSSGNYGNVIDLFRHHLNACPVGVLRLPTNVQHESKCSNRTIPSPQSTVCRWSTLTVSIHSLMNNKLFLFIITLLILSTTAQILTMPESGTSLVFAITRILCYATRICA